MSLPVIKMAAQIVGGVGVSKVVHDIIKNNVTVLTTFDAVKVWTGSFVIGAIVIDRANDYIAESVDQVAEFVEKRKDKIEAEG